MIPHRRVVQRAFTGLVGMPPDEPAPSPDLPGKLRPLTAKERRQQFEERRRAAKAAVKTRVAMTLEERTEEAEAERESREREKFFEKQRKKSEKKAARDEVKASKPPSMSEGKYMKGAPKGKGELIWMNNDSLERKIAEYAADRITEDNEGGEQVRHTREVNPEGNHADAQEDASAFYVKLGGDDQERAILSDLFHLIFEVIPNSNIYRCTLCGFQSDWEKHARQHWEDSVKKESGIYSNSSFRTKMLNEGLAEMPYVPREIRANLAEMKAALLALGSHAKAFASERAARRTHARKVAKAARKAQ